MALAHSAGTLSSPVLLRIAPLEVFNVGWLATLHLKSLSIEINLRATGTVSF